jgi:phosphoadenosine phosphosulfate reductase
MIDPATVIAGALEGAKRPCVTCSFQAEDIVVLHMLRERQPDIPVLFLETFHHFKETLEYRDELTRAWNLTLINLKAEQPRIGLWQSESTTACCAHHKVGPLFSALEQYDVWFTGLRREQSASRANLEEVEDFRLPTGTMLRKISPLARWTNKEVWAYAKAHDIPLLPLYTRGYTSIGCEPCTTPPVDPNNPRSGRWQGQKLECGIHIQVATDATGDRPVTPASRSGKG